jgi:hypothetical protein
MGFGEKIAGVVGAAGGLGNIAQAGFAVGQMIAGSQNRKKADAMLPSSEDAGERQIYNTIRRRRRAIETGTAGFLDKKLVGQNVKQYSQNAFRAGGPVNTGVLAQLMNQGMQNISSQYNQQYNQALGMEQEQAGKMADVKRDLQLLKYTDLKARSARQEQAGAQNLLATLGAGKLSKENKGLKEQLAAYQNEG